MAKVVCYYLKFLRLWHNFGSVDIFENGESIVKAAFDKGITHFDLANNYGPVPGSAETNFGTILKNNFQGNLMRLLFLQKLVTPCGKGLMAIGGLENIYCPV